jgi:CheY-like chemotaxis protein
MSAGAQRDDITSTVARDMVNEPRAGPSPSRPIVAASGSTTPASRQPAAAELDPGLAKRLDRRVLVVDDNAMSQRFAVRMLECCGFEPDTASNGTEAVEAVEREVYDVVFMDLQMPVMDGLQATREIRRRLPPGRQPHIAGVTSGASGARREACVQAGMDDLVNKPLRAGDLVRAIEQSRRH